MIKRRNRVHSSMIRVKGTGHVVWSTRSTIVAAKVVLLLCLLTYHVPSIFTANSTTATMG